MNALNSESQKHSLETRLEKLKQDERVERAELLRLNQPIANIQNKGDEGEVLEGVVMQEESSKELVVRKAQIELSLQLKAAVIQKLEVLLNLSLRKQSPSVRGRMLKIKLHTVARFSSPVF